MMPTTLPSTMLRAWRMAQANACALDEPCALTSAPVTPSSAAPPYCS